MAGLAQALAVTAPVPQSPSPPASSLCAPWAVVVWPHWPRLGVGRSSGKPGPAVSLFSNTACTRWACFMVQIRCNASTIAVASMCIYRDIYLSVFFFFFLKKKKKKKKRRLAQFHRLSMHVRKERKARKYLGVPSRQQTHSFYPSPTLAITSNCSRYFRRVSSY